MPRRRTPDPTAERIGARIRELREIQGLTQEKLAYEAGLSKSHLNGVERGLTMPSIASLALVAARLEVDLPDLFLSPSESPRHRLIDLTRSMTPGTIRRLIREAGG